MLKLLLLYGSYFKVNIKKLVEYKGDFIFNLISVLVWVSIGLINIGIIFDKLQSLKGWSLPEISLLYGMWSLTFAMYNAFGNGILDIENHIVTGSMDVLLTKPISPLIQIVCSRINTMGVGFLVFGVVVMIISAYNINYTWNVLKILYLIVTSITGGLLIFATYLILGSLAFWLLHSTSAIRIGYDIHKFVQYPLSIYGDGIKIILVTIFPYAFTNYYPIAFLLGKVPVFYGILSPTFCIIIFILSLKIWRLGLKRYEGTGS